MGDQLSLAAGRRLEIPARSCSPGLLTPFIGPFHHLFSRTGIALLLDLAPKLGGIPAASPPTLTEIGHKGIEDTGTTSVRVALGQSAHGYIPIHRRPAQFHMLCDFTDGMVGGPQLMNFGV